MKQFIFIICLFTSIASVAQSSFTRQDSLRGGVGIERSWWDVVSYNIYVEPDYQSKTIRGWTEIGFVQAGLVQHDVMQIDLQEPMKATAFTLNGQPVKSFRREGNVYWVNISKNILSRTRPNALMIEFSGKPREAQRAPWDGGWIWKMDAKGRPWMSVACQGLGASVWFPCKDHQGDEPEAGAILHMNVPDTLVAVANGRLVLKETRKGGKMVYAWAVKNPINNYNIIPYIGKYEFWEEKYSGESGQLDCSYWVLDYNLEKAKDQFRQVPMTLRAFEHWFGPYPFYEDGFKMVEAPHLGMEHQSAIAYGNQYLNGYLGKDLSGTGWGLQWDFIIVHEMGHEWYGNNITSFDIADMWVHEGFTNYSETLFTDYHFGTLAGNEYCIGTRQLIQNDRPIIGIYGVNQEGSGDMYYKGGNLVHMIRQLVNDDLRFRTILRKMNQDLGKKIVTGKQVEDFLSRESGIQLEKVFDQYLRTTKLPVLEYRLSKNSLSFRWTNCVENFDMRVKLEDGSWLDPGTQWKEAPIRDSWKNGIKSDSNFYIQLKRI